METGVKKDSLLVKKEETVKTTEIPQSTTILNTQQAQVNTGNMSLVDFKKFVQGEEINTFLSRPRIPTYTTSTLPYQTRGTSYYDSNKGFYTPSTITNYYSRSQIPKFSDFLSNVIEYPYSAVVTIPKEKAKEKEKENLFIFTPQSTSTKRETMSYAPKPL